MKNLNKIMVIMGSFLAIITSLIIISSMVIQPLVEKNIMEKRELVLENHWVTGDANPGDNSGLFYFMIYPHSADPGTDYAVNLSNSSAYEFSDEGNTSCTGETPYGTSFDIIVKVGVTDDDGKNTTTGFFDDSYLWVTLTCADLSISSDTNMTEIQLGNTSSYAWYQYYLNNGGSGYTITEGESFNVTSVKYWVMRIV